MVFNLQVTHPEHDPSCPGAYDGDDDAPCSCGHSPQEENWQTDWSRRDVENLLAQVDDLRQRLYDIHMQATRKDRASEEKVYLLTDLNIIAEKSKL